MKVWPADIISREVSGMPGPFSPAESIKQASN